MGKVALAYGNLVDSSTLSGGSWTGGQPLTNVQEWELATYAQSTTADAADTKILLDHGSAKTARIIGVFATGTTVPSSSTINVKRGTSSGGSEDYAGSAVSCWPFTPIDGIYDGAHFGLFFVMPASTTSRYTTIELVGSVVRIGRVFVGPAFIPTYNPTELHDDWQEPSSTVDLTESKADWVHQRDERRRVGLVYQGLSRAEGSLLHEITRTHSIAREVIYIPDISGSGPARARTQQFGFLGRLSKLNALQYPTPLSNSMAIGINERGGAP